MNANDRLLQIGMLLQAQRDAHRLAPFPEWQVRRDRLQRLHKMLVDNESAIEDAIDADFGGRPRIETQVAEVFPSLAEIRAALRGGRRWMKPRSVWVSKWFLPARAWIMPRPVGVVGIIVPWNYPLYLTIGPLAGAIAAGNRALIKPSEYTPAFSALLQRLVAVSFSAEEIAVVTGGPEVAEAFAALPFDHLLFTGSGSVGRKVMAAASANLTPITLELGGKSPAVIAPGYSIERAATRIMAGKLLNAGQTCIAPDYVLVPRPELTRFVDRARAQAQKMYPAGLADPDYCSIVDTRQYERLVGYLDDATAGGVQSVELFRGPVRDDAAHRLAPVILVDPPHSLVAMRHEIFGPILPVLPYDRPEDAVAFVNAMAHPLALYWFDDDRRRADWALKQTHVGGVCINETLLHVTQEELPFGGIGPSGMGHYHGKWGFDTMSKLTPVFRQSRLSGVGLFMPPYRPIARRLLALMKRF
ncbi:MAG TPA: coniferyl aldehyde dehydrogenase [Burkholderiaceae bacterium]|nr:coniferyl aldehyde dehydrogenase [Burkholderiaceae bacterium]